MNSFRNFLLLVFFLIKSDEILICFHNTFKKFLGVWVTSWVTIGLKKNQEQFINCKEVLKTFVFIQEHLILHFIYFIWTGKKFCDYFTNTYFLLQSVYRFLALLFWKKNIFSILHIVLILILLIEIRLKFLIGEEKKRIRPYIKELCGTKKRYNKNR